MHHSKCFIGKASCSSLLILALGIGAQARQVLAQPILTQNAPSTTQPAPPQVLPPATPVRGGAVVIPINQTQRLQMRTKKKIARASNPKEHVARVQPIPNDPTAVLVTG